MEKNLPAVIYWNLNPSKKNIAASFKKLSLTFFVSAFVFLAGMVPGKSFAGNFNETWTSVTTSNSCVGILSNYTLIANTENTNGADIPSGKAVVITFPSGFTLSSITGGTFQGTTIGTISKTATTVSFNVPSGVSVSKKSSFTIVLNGITNNSTAGNYQLSMAIDNSTGTGTGNQDLFAASTLSQFTINPNATISLTSGSATPSVCVNSAMTNSIYTIANATSASVPPGSLPAGVTGTFSNGTYTISGTPTVTGSFPFTITTSGASCANTSTSGTITVNPLPTTVTVTGGGTFCNSATLTASNGSSGTIYFQGTTSNGTSTAVPSTSQSVTSSGTYYFRAQSASGCWGNQGSATVTINSTSAPTGSTQQPFCASSNPTVANLVATGTSIQWYAAATGGTALAGTTALTNGTHYYASQTVSGCESTYRLDVTATVNNPAAPTGNATQTFCASNNPTVANLTPNGTNIKWYTAATGGTPLTTTTTLIDGTHYYASQTVSGCESTSRLDVTATVSSPAAPTGNSSQTFCASNNPTVANLAPNGTNIKWYTAATGGTPLTTTTPLVDGTHYYASQTVSGCEGTSRLDVIATVSSPAAPTGTASQTFCSSTNPTVANLTATGTNIQWYAAASGGAALASTTPLVDGNHYYASQTVSGCEGTARFNVTVTVSNPAAPTGNASQTFCSSNNPTIADLTATGTGIKWYNASSGGTAFESTTPLVNGTHYYASQMVVNCEGTSRLDVAVIIFQAPAITTQPKDTAVCGTTALSFTVAATGDGLTYQWYKNGSKLINTKNITGVTTNTLHYNQASSADDGAKFTVTVSGTSSCPSVTSNAATLSVDQKINITAQPADTAVCTGSDATFTTAANTNNNDNLTYQWFKAPNSIISGATSPSYTITSVSPSNAGDYYAVISGPNGVYVCADATTQSATLTVNPASTISLSSQTGTDAQTACINTAITNITYSVTGATNATVTGLPSGVSGTYSSGVVTISGTPTQSGPFTYTVTPTGGCGTANATGTITVNAAQPVSVSISASNTAICAGTSVTFTAAPTNGGSNPSYQWKVNGTNAGTNSATFTTSTLANNDKVTVVLTSNATPCATGNPATSNTITETVNPNLPVSVSISTTTSTICAGTSVTFTATATNGGTAPSYQWQVNGTNTGSDSPTFTTSTLANGDKVTVVLTSNATPCATGNPATSNTITETVNPNLPVSVSISTTTSTICAGSSVTFTAIPTNGGTAPSYQWKVNGNNAGTNNATFTTSTLANGDKVTVVLTSNATPCATGNPATSNTITETVNPNLPVSVAISTTTPSICAGSSVTFTAAPTNGGSAPAYQWKVNGNNAGTNNATFTTSTLANGDKVTVVLTSNATSCATGNPATSNTITETVNPNLPVGVSITATNTTICAGTSVTFTATPTNGGTTPSYQWKVNGATAPAGTNSNTFTTATLNNSDVVTVVLTSNATPCATGNPATSNSITMTVNPNATITLSSEPGTDAQAICLNSSITNIKYTVGSGGTGASIPPGSLPAGVTSSFNTNTKVFTISGTPTVSGVYTYTVTATGGCANPTAGGSIRINAPFTPNITASPTGAVCAGTSVTLTATGYDSVDYIPGGDFVGGNPTGWSGASANNSNGAANSNWGEANGGKTYGQTVYDNSNTPSKGKFMIVDGLTDDQNTKTAVLTTPTFSTVGMTTASISWYQAYNFNGAANGLAELSLDGGSTYMTLDTYTASTQTTNGGNPNGRFVLVTYNLNNYLERTNLKIRWTYHGTSNSNWAIDDVVIGGPKQPITYNWGSAGSGQSITVTPTQTTTYTVSASTTNGCSPTTKSITISVNPLPTATISGTTPVCQKDSKPSITFTGDKGTAPYTFTYNINGGPNKTIVSGTGTNPVSVTVPATTDTTAGTYTYNLMSVQGQYCTNTTSTATGSATITVNPLPAVSAITGTTTVCVNSTTTLSDATTGGTWSSNNTNVATISTSGIVTGVTAGIATITYTVTNTNNCTSTTTATVTVNALPTVAPITGTTTVCVNGTTTLSDATTGGTWSSNNTNVATISTSGMVTGVTAGTATITYTVTNTNNCTSTTTATITVNPLPAVSAITGTTTVCVNGTTTLSDATTGGTWTSSNTSAATVDNQGVVRGVAQGTSVITYTVTNTNSCTNSSTATVTVNALPTVAPITGTNSVCAGKMITLSDATTGGTWSSSNTTIATVSNSGVVTGIAEGQATITYTIAPSNSCPNSTTATITVNPTPAPTITAQGPTASCTGSVVLHSSIPTGNQWYRNNVAITPLLGGTLQDYIAKDSGRYTVVVTNSSNCSGTSNAIDVSFIINSWIAAADSNWNNPANWCSGQVPTASTDAVIPSNAVRFPVLSKDAQVRSLEVQQGAKISLNGHSFTINGTLTGTGKWSGSNASTLAFSSTSSSATLYFDQTKDAITNVLDNFTISSSVTVTLANKLYITGTLAPNSSTLNIADTSNLTLRSSLNQTARVAEVSGKINGNVTVERFIPARRAYRFLSPSVTTTTTVKANWMEGGVNNSINPPPVDPHPGYGTNITGAGGKANGFDPTITSNPSLFTFDNSTQQFVAATNTNGTLSIGVGYSMMVRGDRTIDMRTNNPDPKPTTLRATGTLKIGNYSPGLSNKGGYYTLIGNPYASPVDFTKMWKNSSNVTATYWAWDPRLSTRGAYVAYNAAGDYNNNDTSEVNRNIQSGQAVFVQTKNSGSASLNFEESYKTDTNRHVFRDPHQLTKLSIQLLLSLNGGLENNADGAVAFFDKNFSNAIGDEDSYKFTNPDENLAINQNGTSLSIEGRQPVVANDTIHLKMWQFGQKNYSLRLTGSHFSPDVTAFVNDNYLHKQTPVDLSSVTVFPFSVDTSIAASYATDRFSIVFRAATALPVTLTNVKAYQKDQGIEVDWTAEAETNIQNYEVQKSADGQHFDKATVLTAKGNNSITQMYGWLDENPNTGSNFYRIKVTDKSGAVKYSNVVSVNIAEVKGSITVFPNPIKDNLIQVKFNNLEKGRYSVVLYNTLGQKLYSSTIEHTSRSGTYRISLGRLISKGTYTLHISKGDTMMNERVVVE